MDQNRFIDQDEIAQSLYSDRFANAMAELLTAWHYAAITGLDIWEFAVEAHLLQSLGASRTDFRFLMSQGYIRHGVEVGVRSRRRLFHECNELVFRENSAFVLTRAGRSFAMDLVGENSREYRQPDESFEIACESHAGNHETIAVTLLNPVWNMGRHELTIGSKLVKRFKWRASNQEVILATFQEEDWADRIDDPLPPQPDQDPKRRLHDTIKCLNRKQVNELIKFRGDGTGEGVIWERQ